VVPCWVLLLNCQVLCYHYRIVNDEWGRFCFSRLLKRILFFWLLLTDNVWPLNFVVKRSFWCFLFTTFALIILVCFKSILSFIMYLLCHPFCMLELINWVALVQLYIV